MSEFATEYEPKYKAGNDDLLVCWNCTPHGVGAFGDKKIRHPKGGLVPLGAGACWDCVEVRSRLDRSGLLEKPIYARLQWAAAADKMIRDRTLEDAEKAIKDE